jgi:hypothetical protein
MSSGSPDAVLYDQNGNPLAVQNDTTIPTSTPAVMAAGSDGANSRYLLVDGYGRLITVGPGTDGTPVGGVTSIQGVSGGTAVPVSGTVISNQGAANTLANGWPVEITNGINGPVAVKPTNTSAIAADSSLVVSLTPNLPISVTISSTAINASANGNNTLIAGVAGKTIRVFKAALVFSAGGTVIFQDGSSALTGPMALYTGATVVLDMDVTNPWFLTSAGNSFVANLAGGAAVGGVMYYTQS